MRIERLSIPGGAPFNSEEDIPRIIDEHLHRAVVVAPGVHELNVEGMNHFLRKGLVVDYEGKGLVITPPSVMQKIKSNDYESVRTLSQEGDKYILFGPHKTNPGVHLFEFIICRKGRPAKK